MANTMDNEELMGNEESKVEIEGETPEDSSLVSVPASDEALPAGSQKGERQWFVIHCYSGYENKVRKNLEQRIETMNMKDRSSTFSSRLKMKSKFGMVSAAQWSVMCSLDMYSSK